MEKTLSTIQTITKIGRILAKVAFVFSIIGVICSLVVLIFTAAFSGGDLKIGGMSISALVSKEAGMTTGTMIAQLINSCIQSAVFLILSLFAGRYFENEQEAGTPFTLDGAKEMKRLGIIWIAAPIVASVVESIVTGAVRIFSSGVAEIKIAGDGEVIVGVMFLVLSLVFQYGAELEEKERMED